MGLPCGRSPGCSAPLTYHLYKDPHVPGTRLHLHFGDLADSVQLVKLLYELKPDEVYHLGAQSHVRVSFDIPEYTGDVTGLGAVRILEAIRETGLEKRTAYYQASSSEMFRLAKPMACTPATASCSTMSRRAGGRPL